MQKAGIGFNASAPSFLYNPVSLRLACLRTSFVCPAYHVRSANHPCRYPPRRTRQTFRPTSTLCDSPLQPLPRTTVKYVDPVTSSTIYIIGCVHGSYVSAVTDDVKEVLTVANPDAIVLELCESRLASLRKMIRHAKPNRRLSTTEVKGRSKRTFSQISRTFKGTPQALLAVFLDTAYKLQVVSGLDPGIEFLHPIRDFPPSTVFCGDAPASETIHRLYRVFVTPLQSIRSSLSALQGIICRVFQPPHGGVNLPAVLFFDSRRLRELAQLTLSAALVGLGFVVLGNVFSLAFEAAVTTSQISAVTSNAATVSIVWDLIQNVTQFVLVTYIIVSVLSFFKVLILDRDAIIADRIVETTWRQAVTHRKPITVCAVVGLLHVNGILQQLQDTKHDE